MALRGVITPIYICSGSVGSCLVSVQAILGHLFFVLVVLTTHSKILRGCLSTACSPVFCKGRF